MKKAYPPELQTRLWEAIKAVEQHSHVEIAVVLRSRSADYQEVALMWGVLLAWLAFSYVMFAPELFSDTVVYAAPLLAFVLGYALGHNSALTRLSVKKPRLHKQVEIMARAIFQKGGIHHTQRKIGVLVYVSLLEKRVYVLPDRGVAVALPATQWQSLQDNLQSIFNTRKPLEALILQLQHCQPLFNRYLPPLADDINELPDDLDVDL